MTSSNNSLQKNKKVVRSSLIKYCEGMSDEPINKINCKFCQSKIRAEGEAEWEKTTNYSSVYNFLKMRKVDISRSAVRNHIRHHYMPTVKKAYLEAYSVDLEKFLKDEQDHRTQLRERTWILQRLLYDIAAESETESLEEKRRSADALKKLSDTVMTLEDRISDIDKLQEPVEIIIQRLSGMFSAKMRESSNEETKRTLMELLEELITSTDDLYVEDNVSN